MLSFWKQPHYKNICWALEILNLNIEIVSETIALNVFKMIAKWKKKSFLSFQYSLILFYDLKNVLV